MDAIRKIEAMPPLPEPEVLRQPEDGELIAAHEDENAPYCWAWMSHGYDTGMEPYFGADQVYRYARDYAAQTLASKDAELVRLRSLLARYRNETPLGHQPHMIAEEVDAALTQPTE